MKKWNVTRERWSACTTVWEDEVHLCGLSDLEMHRIHELPLHSSFTDMSDSIWYRVQ